MTAGTKYPRATPAASNVASGERNVTTAGTPEALVATSTPCRGVLIRAKSANTDNILIGPEGGASFPLAAGEAIEVQVADVATVWVDAATSGEGVNWIAEVD